MSEKDLIRCFNTSDEFVTSLSSCSGQLKKYKREEDFINRLTQGDLGLKKATGTLDYIGEVEGTIKRKDIIKALVESGLVRNFNSLLGRYLIRRNIRRVHQTDYWRGYYFKQESNKSEIYRMELEDVSGIPPF